MTQLTNLDISHRPDAVQNLTSLVSRLHGLNRKLEEGKAGQRTYKRRVETSRLRLEFVRAEDHLPCHYICSEVSRHMGRQRHMKEMQRVFAIVAFKSNPDCAVYYSFFLNQKQWDFLVELFKQEFCRLYGMTSRAVAEIYSTGQGYSPENSTTVMKMIAPRKDPAVTGELQEVGTCTLPFSKQQPLKDCLLHKLKNYMDTENPPHKSCLKALFTALRHLKKWPREMMSGVDRLFLSKFD
ncbi:hypothetical protein NC651_019710 [Populus alba x Populus x berolinensis]|nr:hypothetical protein NC651_019710 [Populus alba x Populus x berolinensis]